jgi:hypothetical protein
VPRAPSEREGSERMTVHVHFSEPGSGNETGAAFSPSDEEGAIRASYSSVARGRPGVFASMRSSFARASERRRRSSVRSARSHPID